MWQFVLVAAVAGSTGFFAKHLRAATKADPSAAGDTNDEKSQDCVLQRRDQTETCPELHGEIETSGSCRTALQSPPIAPDGSVAKEEGIFRFSSPESGIGNGKGGGRSLRRRGGFRSGKGAGSEKKPEVFGGAVRVGVEQRKVARRVSVWLKKRRTDKNLDANRCGSCPEGSSLFGWGLGVGMMYMMSAGKSEISKLNTAMDETAKVIEELKDELNIRKSSSSIQMGCHTSEVKTNAKKCGAEKENREPHDIKLSGLPAVDDAECPSSVLTEEQEPELLEMDQLEAELVSELQKLPWCTAEASHPPGMRQNLHEYDPVNDAENEMELQVSDPYQFHGVQPSELDQKLSHLLIEQQENQIIELESELQTTQLKLNEKEAELRALKDCVRRMTELSLSTVTDDETEAHEGVGGTDNWDYNNMVRSESKSIVGMKRSIDSELCGY